MIDTIINATPFFGLGLMVLALCMKFIHIGWLIVREVKGQNHV